ncbi:MAG: MFS transporter [Micrococcales bacterium]|nr:MFS transporter [Actinomycetota bacterium]NCA07900.1 MFS transporter [Micrococcales bacterium]
MLETAKTQWSKIQAMAIARAFSLLGSELTIFTLVFREKNQGPAAVAALFIVGTLPMILFAPWAGTIADRFSTRTVIPIASVIGGATIFAQSQQLPNYLILTLLFIANTCASVVGPTWGKLTPTLAKKEDISRAMGTIQSYFSIAGLFGPALAGFLVAKTGFVLTFMIDGFLTSFIALVPFLINVNHKPQPLEPGDKTSVAAGFKFMMDSPLLRSLVILVFGMVLCMSVVNVGDVFLLTDIMGADSFIYGLVGTGFALGTLLFSAFTGSRKVSPKTELVILGFGMSILSLSGFGVGIAPNYWFIMVVWFIAGMGNATINSYGVGMMIKITPHEVQGRVFAAFGAIISIASIGSMSVAGYLIGVFGVRNVFVIAGSLAFIAFLILFPTVYKEQLKIIKAE